MAQTMPEGEYYILWINSSQQDNTESYLINYVVFLILFIIMGNNWILYGTLFKNGGGENYRT